jgi:Uncharacterised protein family (UPF0175)
LAASLTPPGQESARAALEAWGLEAYRGRRLTAYQLRLLLGIPSRWEMDAFLKEHAVYDYSLEEFESDLDTVRAAHAQRQPDSPA